jgi:prepilin-type N-terminal cleavage/methylation domain-containing protein
MRRDDSVAQRQRWFFTLLALRRKSGAGFTLIELLVALLISGIMISVLLALVVQLMSTNQREAARSDVQRDAQAAIDYISRDLKEAVYVYDGQCLQQGTGVAIVPASPPTPASVVCPGLLRYLPTGLDQAGGKQPVLAFWRLEDLPAGIQTYCKNNADAIAPADPTKSNPPLNVQNPLTWPSCATGKMYTLVVYSIDSDNLAKTWRGKARLTRYKLPQYPDNATDGKLQSDGWVSPIQTGLSFLSWPLDTVKVAKNYQNDPKTPPTINDSRGGDRPPTDATTVVLMDFLDNALPDAAKAGDADDTKLCPDLPNAPQNTKGGFNLSVLTGKTKQPVSRGFYACVRGSEISATGGELANQEVVIRLKANAAGKAGLPNNGKTDVPITMEARVLSRGALGKKN